MVKKSMTPAHALLAATAADADLLGLTDKIGRIETGKLADLVAALGDPLQDIRQTEKVTSVMQGAGGQEFRRDGEGASSENWRTFTLTGYS